MNSNPCDDPRIRFFDELADTWDAAGPPLEEQIQRLEGLRDRLGLRSGDGVLEIGCGTGLVTGWLARRVSPGKVTAIDFSTGMLRRARERNPHVQCLAWDVCSGPLPTGDHDVAFCLHVVPHFRDHAAAYRNIAASLRPNGLLVVLHLSGRDHVNGIHRRVGGAVEHDLLPRASDLCDRLRSAGFSIEEAVDEPDLFLVRARKAARLPAAL